MNETPRLWQVTINRRWTTACSAFTAIEAMTIVGRFWRDDVSAGEDRGTIREIHVRRMNSVTDFLSSPVPRPDEVFFKVTPPPE